MTTNDKPKKTGRGRPVVPLADRRFDVHMRLPRATVDQLDTIAADDGETRTATVERLVEDEVERREKKRS